LPVSREANAACQKETGGQRDLFPGGLLTLCSWKRYLEWRGGHRE